MKLYKVEAVVLWARDCGGGNKLLTLYSREYGKMKVMAHGVAKPSSRKRGAVQPFTFTKFLIHRGRELDSVSQCEALEMFSFLGADLEKIAYASYMAELVDSLTPEWEPCEGLFDLLLDTLRLLAGNDAELLLRSFEIKAAGLMGYRPVLDACVYCRQQTGRQVFFSAGQGGVLCGECGSADPGALPCSRGLVEVLKILLNWKPAKLRQLKVERRDRDQIKKILYEYLKYHLEQDLKSTVFMNRFCPNFTGFDV